MKNILFACACMFVLYACDNKQQIKHELDILNNDILIAYSRVILLDRLIHDAESKTAFAIWPHYTPEVIEAKRECARSAVREIETLKPVRTKLLAEIAILENRRDMLEAALFNRTAKK